MPLPLSLEASLWRGQSASQPAWWCWTSGPPVRCIVMPWSSRPAGVTAAAAAKGPPLCAGRTTHGRCSRATLGGNDRQRPGSRGVGGRAVSAPSPESKERKVPRHCAAPSLPFFLDPVCSSSWHSPCQDRPLKCFSPSSVSNPLCLCHSTRSSPSSRAKRSSHEAGRRRREVLKSLSLESSSRNQSATPSIATQPKNLKEKRQEQQSSTPAMYRDRDFIALTLCRGIGTPHAQ